MVANWGARIAVASWDGIDYFSIMETLFIAKQDVESVLTPSLANETVERAFKAYGLGLAQMPAKSYIYFERGDLRSMPAYIHGEGFNVAGVKSVTVHPGNALRHLPTVMAVIILHDPESGFPMAIMDGTFLTGLRTGAAGAVAAKYLSRKTAKVAGFVGTGVQARAQLSSLLLVRNIEKIKIWQFAGDEDRTQEFKAWAETACNLKTFVSSAIDDITADVDILVTTTPSRVPLVRRVSPGTHINAIGADAAGKEEIDPAILRQAKVVVDDWAQASHSGEINVPVSQEKLRKEDIHGELGEILAGKITGRASEEEITLFDATGLAIQDVSCAAAVYEVLKNRREIKKVRLF